MFDVNIDIPKNKFILIYKDYFDSDDAKKLCQKIEQVLPLLKKGITVLTDLSSLKHMDADSRGYLQKAMDLLNEYGVSKLIRIIPDPQRDIGFNIMTIFHYSEHVATITCRSMKEAEKHLK